jgi:hypothetical protein
MVVYAIASLVFALQTPRRFKDFAWIACPGAVSVALAAIYAIRSEPLKAASIRAVPNMTMPLLAKVSDLPGALFSLGDASLALFAASVLAIAGLALRPQERRDEPSSQSEPRWLEWAREARFGILAAALLGLYFVMPLTFSGSTLIHQRFLAPAFALAALTTGARRPAPGWAPLLLAFPVAMLGLMWGDFLTQDAEYRDLDVILSRMADRSAVAQLDLTPHRASVVAPVVGGAARALAVHGGRLLFSFTDAPAYPVSVPAQFQWNEPVLRLSRAPYAFLPEHDLRRFRYVLAKLTAPQLRGAIVDAFAPEATLVTEAGPWLLFESNLPLVPLTDPDEPLPAPLPMSLGQRVQAILRAGAVREAAPSE